jgi:DNA-binding transcriptional LysR family regulator
MIERYLLRYFLAVVDNGNFSRAAQQMNVAQPTLSVGISKLESRLGVSLFERSSRRISLTPAGTRLLEHARRIERDFNLAEREVLESRKEPRFRFGVLTTISSRLIADALARALAHDPHSKVELLEGNEREIVNLLSRGRIDAALTLVHRGSGRFQEMPLFEEGYSVAMPAVHRAAEQAVVSAEDLGDNVMIVRRSCEVLSDVSRHFLDRGIRPSFGFKSKNDDRVLQLISAGLGITVVPERSTHDGVVLKPLSGFEMRRTVGFALGEKTHMSQVEQAAIGQSLMSLSERVLSKEPGLR